jgi:hypothetical protein
VKEMAQDDKRVGLLPPEVKVAIAIDMINSCVGIAADGIRAQYPDISDEELLVKLRERVEWKKRQTPRLR